MIDIIEIPMANLRFMAPGLIAGMTDNQKWPPKPEIHTLWKL